MKGIKSKIIILISMMLCLACGCGQLQDILSDVEQKLPQMGDILENSGSEKGEKITDVELLTDEPDTLYCYRMLTEDEKIWYTDIYEGIKEMQEEKELTASLIPTLGEESIDKLFQCVMNDHPELFYVSGYTYTLYSYGDEITKIGFSGNFTMDKVEREQKQHLIDQAVNAFLKGIDEDASDYEKVKAAYEYLVYNTEYNKAAKDNQNICSVFIENESVCQGYAKANQYLLEKMGIPATLVIGVVTGGESHAWNLVEVDGEYYYVDATWGDASYQAADGDSPVSSFAPQINYDYLCVTTDQLMQTHSLQNVVDMPQCVSMDANYYVMEGAYFSAYDKTKIEAYVQKCLDEGKEGVTFKCSSAELYDTFYEKLVTDRVIFDYMATESGYIAYIESPDKFSLTFYLVNE